MRCLARSSWLALVCAAVFGSACGERAAQRNVLLVVLDTFRADRMAAYGSTRGLTPFLDELATRGVVFERAYAPSSWTSPSVASLLTSRHPLQHSVTRFDSVLGESEVTLAESLRSLGFATAGFSANLRLTEHLGYGQGFDAWRTLLTEGNASPKVRARELRQKALSWLDARVELEQPVLLYLQYMDTHSPYDPPEALRERFAPGLGREAIDGLNARLHAVARFERPAVFTAEEAAQLAALYDAEVAGLDAELRQLFADLEARRFLDDALVVVIADHGEEFGEHETFLHGNTLFEAGVRVPLLLLGPGLEPGRRVAEPVSLVDVAPTLLALLGARTPTEFEGRPLWPARASAAPGHAAGRPADDVLLELAAEEGPPEARTHVLGLVRGTRKLLVDPAGHARVYELASDPSERIAITTPTGHLDLVAALLSARERLAARGVAPHVSLFVDEQTREALRALGYAVEGAEAGASARPAPPLSAE